MESLAGKVALITGGGRGLGESTCRALAESGAHIICADIKEDLAANVIKKLDGRAQDSFALKLDVADEKAVEKAVELIFSKFGHIDILVNNAGVDVTVPIEEMTARQWDNIINVNLRGPFLTSKKVFSVMKAQKAGHIINVTSTAAKRAWANACAYHASKWGLMGFSHALHVEARKYNVKVTAVVSGGMRTPFLLDRFPDIDLNNLQDPDNVAQTIRFVLMQPPETVIPEVMVLPLRETSWP